jgi:RimJ/RimL family protein N-acetyltransferase
MPLTSPVDDLLLETPRLLLRPPRAGDLDDWAAFMVDAEAVRFLGGTMSRSMSWRAMMTMIGAWHAQGLAMFSVIEKSTRRGRTSWTVDARGLAGHRDWLGDRA